MNVVLPTRLTVDELLAWSVRQERGKYELFDGAVVMQQSQQWEHAKVKAAVYMALARAIGNRGLAYYAAPDGMTVRITKRTAFEPDALVAPLPEPDRKSLEVPNPIIVVEVLSPSTARADATTKLRGYFQVASVQHYLILDPDGLTITHHKRGAGNLVETRVLGRRRSESRSTGFSNRCRGRLWRDSKVFRHTGLTRRALMRARRVAAAWTFLADASRALHRQGQARHRHEIRRRRDIATICPTPAAAGY